MTRYWFLILTFLLVRAGDIHCQEDNSHSAIVVGDSSEVSELSSQKHPFISRVKRILNKERSFIIAPEFGRKPETGFLTGIYYLQLFKLSHRDTTSRTSNIESYIDYTERKQTIAQIKNNLLFKGEKFILRGDNEYTKFPSLFWGIGTKTTPGMQESISFEMTSIKQRLVRKLGRRYFAGVQYYYMKVSNVHYTSGDIFDQQMIPGRYGSTTSGAGLVFLYDSRDNILNAYKGFYLDASVLINPKTLGGGYDYNNVTIDARKYISLSKKRVRILALQALLNYNTGNVPWRQMATMGGDQIMRGYYTGRFRDKVIMAAQTEFRFLVWKRIGMTTFVSVAEVGPKLSTYNWNDIHYTIGGCLRYMINKKERLNVGIDTGFGHQTNGLYFNSGEAF